MVSDMWGLVAAPVGKEPRNGEGLAADLQLLLPGLGHRCVTESGQSCVFCTKCFILTEVQMLVVLFCCCCCFSSSWISFKLQPCVSLLTGSGTVSQVGFDRTRKPEMQCCQGRANQRPQRDRYRRVWSLHCPVNGSPAAPGLVTAGVRPSQLLADALLWPSFRKGLGEQPRTSVRSASSDPRENSLLRASEFDQDHEMIMFSLQVDCELNVSGWQPRSIAFPLFFFFFLRPSSLQQRPLADTLSISQQSPLQRSLDLASGQN